MRATLGSALGAVLVAVWNEMVNATEGDVYNVGKPAKLAKNTQGKNDVTC